ncbi:hypothetical protein DUNSADRAFT_16018 [Dunaliella salina]|uniref:non-specific serine/threonine protein kinase n=1 Tax=Dunaliella salina TaxID=3046 RepID=A0ABQ7H1D1_DUNSA|nr:hypothetical protein DUNSADRAFT_16018 [Dunaliella salina]|eukprot:KAF5840645.1 hypothetical protein DUNSADRAFT_16018 [Dunaliella salina]
MSSKQPLLSTTPPSAPHRSSFEGSCRGREVCSDPQPDSIHDQLEDGQSPARPGADEDDLHALAAGCRDPPSCQMLHTGRRSSTLTQLRPSSPAATPAAAAAAVQPAPQSQRSRLSGASQPSAEEITQPDAAASRQASAQQHAPTSEPFPFAGRRSSVLLPQAASMEIWNGGGRSSAQPAPAAAAAAAAAAATGAATEKGGEARRATFGRRSSARPAAAEKGGEARRRTAGRRSSVLVHPQAIQTEGSALSTLPPMPQGTRNTRARSSGVAAAEARRRAAVDGRHGECSNRSSNASTNGWDEREERVTEGAAVASDVEMEGGRDSGASEGDSLHVVPYRGSRQRGSKGSLLAEAATCLGDCAGDVNTVPSLSALPEGDEEDGRRAEEEGLERVTQKGWEDGSRDQEEARTEQGEAKSVSTVAGAVGGQQGQGFVRMEGSRDDGQSVDTGPKHRSTSKGAARGGRRGGSRAAAKQRGGEAKSEVTDAAKQRRSGVESVVTDAAKQRWSDIESEVTDAAKQRRGEVESEETDTACGARDQGWGGTAEGEEVEGAPRAQAPLEELTPLQQLLQVCSQSVDTSQIPSMDAFIGAQADLRKISKIGEGTYGEAFKHNKIVFKVVPVGGEQLINGAPQKQAQEMAAEALIALTLTSLRYQDAGGMEQQNVTPSFVETFEVGVCRGPYTPQLVRAWHKWDKAHGSENDPVDSLQPDQLYLVIAMRDCGRDLEKASIASFDQARSLLVQVALTLAIAEEAVEFEHRDLHWGNVLVRPADSVSLGVRLRGVDIEVQTHGMAASIIDFTASRLRTLTGALAYCDLSCDPELFEGTKGVIQFDTYRWMRRLNQDDWSSSCFATNCLWMAYLAEMIVKEKAAAMSAAQKRQLRDFRKRASQTLSCGDLICDELFQGLWIAKADAQ